MPDFTTRSGLIDDLIALFVLLATVACVLMFLRFQMTDQNAGREPTNEECWLILHDGIRVEPFTTKDCMP